MHWQTARFRIDLTQPKVMGIVNLTPDSFSDGGQHGSALEAVRHCVRLLCEGADLLDLGAESSRPGTSPVPLEEELARLLPVLGEAVRLGVPVSVDTYKPQVMQRALDLGADIINDIWALRQPGAREVVASHATCGVCLMHMHGEPRTMQRTPMTGRAVTQVAAFLSQQTDLLRDRGVSAERIVWDAGVGFGKTVTQNFELLAHQQTLVEAGYPLLAAWSRKSSLGKVTGEPLDGRVAASIAVAVLAVERGARIVRAHDVRETAGAIKVWAAANDPAAIKEGNT